MNPKPYSIVREVLSFALAQVESDLSKHPEDLELLRLKSSLERRLAMLEEASAPDASGRPV